MDEVRSMCIAVLDVVSELAWSQSDSSRAPNLDV